jgi:hypothetical protein
MQNLEKKVRNLIYDKRETWFGGDDDDELTLDDIEHNWMPLIKSYKKKYLLRTFFPKNIKSYSRAVSVYDNEENELSIDAIVGDSNLITILQLGGLKFSSTYFHLELNVRQVMVIKEKELFNKCLIKLNNLSASLQKEDINYKNAIKDDYDEEEEDDDDEEGEIEDDDDNDYDDTAEQNEKEQMNEKILVVKKNEKSVEFKNVSETNNPTLKLVKEGENVENVNTLVKNDNNNEISEINLEIPKEASNVSLKKPNEVYLEIYKKAREKAKEARLEAIKAYLTVKEIKKQYLLEEIDLSEEESDDDDFLFSEK